MTDTEPILVDTPATGVRRITMNRPDKLNALTRELVDALHAALDDADADHECRAGHAPPRQDPRPQQE